MKLNNINYDLNNAELIQFKTYEDANNARYDIYNWFDIWAIIISYKNSKGKTIYALRVDN